MEARSILATVLACLSASVSRTADTEAEIDGLFAAVRAHARQAGDRLFPGYASAPFGLLLVMDAQEMLLCHKPVPGFTATGIDSVTGCTRQIRPRHFPTNLLAAMPALDDESVIVVGTPEATGRTEAEWIRTLYHEHFHQYEASLPGYYARVRALHLDGGDRTGMWMLNYPFPYADPKLRKLFHLTVIALANAAEARETARFRSRFAAYMKARANFAKSVPPAAWRYFEFELWNEGTARWMEISLGKTDSDPGVRLAAARLEQNLLDDLRTMDLAERGREVVYSIGAVEAMLMEACGAGWRKEFSKSLATGTLLRHSFRALAL